MKRIALRTLPVLLSLCIGAAAMSVAKRPALPTPKWTQLASNSPTIEWWRTTLDTTEPEVAVLRLPDSDYQTFAADPKKYLNDHHILSKPANEVLTCNTSVVRGESEAAWTVIVSHTPNSTVSYAASQL